ncbi:MAG: OmpA family protein [Bacteroidota bacterium]|nr:OmpA family protein [Bacteroidota bacterium]
MTSKKYKIFLIGFFSLLTFGAFAQDTGVYNIYDSSVISSKGMAQQNEFMNNTYDFPAKPRSEFEFGISAGMFSVSSDVSAKLPTVGFSAHVRKALGYIFSMRLQYVYGVAKGLNWKPSFGYSNNPAWSAYSVANQDPVYYNYRAHVQDLSLQGIFTLNNIRFHKQKTGMVLYGGIGFGATIYNTKVQTTNSSGQPLNFRSITGSGYKDRKKIRDELKTLLKDAPYRDAENNRANNPTIGDNTLKPSGTVLAGIAFKLGKRVNLALEDRFTFIKDDLLDGQQWQEHPVGDPVQTRDFDSYNYVSIGLNFNMGSKSVEPLWWINPLDYAYSEINNPKHMKLPKPVFDDADGDGVVDQLDREPNTPAGCPVDTHGVSRDTDGDGVPDCKDKQLITPTECQPVDADGVGKCPDPECCKNIVPAPPACQIGDLPSVSFRGNSGGLSSDAKAMLATVASKLKNNADCGITVTGYPAASKASQALCNKRIDAVKAYLTEKEGISADRITTNCEVGGGDSNTVDIKAK